MLLIVPRTALSFLFNPTAPVNSTQGHRHARCRKGDDFKKISRIGALVTEKASQPRRWSHPVPRYALSTALESRTLSFPAANLLPKVEDGRIGFFELDVLRAG